MQVKIAKKTVLVQSPPPSWAPFWSPKGAQERPKSSPREAQELPRGLQKWVPIPIQFLKHFLMIFHRFLDKNQGLQRQKQQYKSDQIKESQHQKNMVFPR